MTKFLARGVGKPKTYQGKQHFLPLKLGVTRTLKILEVVF
jgi:hypothetical protein